MQNNTLSILYRLNRSSKRKHTYITICKDGSVLVKTNLFTPKSSIEKFLKEKESWILHKQQSIVQALENSKHYYYLLGEKVERGNITQAQIDTLYKERAKEIIPPLVVQYSKEMNLYPTALSFRKNRSRWGSCSAKNRLSFNTNLIQTPMAFIEYVVVHELAHIAYKNHSRTFWQLVENYLPDYKKRRALGKERYHIL